MRHLSFVAALSMLVCCGPDARAQTLEEQHAIVCGNGAQNVACDNLTRALEERRATARDIRALIEGANEQTRKLTETWGFLAYLPGTVWARGGTASAKPNLELAYNLAELEYFEWVEGKAAIRYIGELFPQIIFRPGPEKGTLMGEILLNEVTNEKKQALFRFDQQGILASEWFRWSVDYRVGFKFSENYYGSQTLMVKKNQRPDFWPWQHSFRKVSGQELANIVANDNAASALIKAQAEQKVDELVRQREQRRRERWN